jgi:hypothetical protein
MLKLQPNGEDGALPTNGYATIFHIRDTEEVLWAVRVSWDADYRGWLVYADSVLVPDGWGADHCVCSR